MVNADFSFFHNPAYSFGRPGFEGAHVAKGIPPTNEGILYRYDFRIPKISSNDH
jgi:hypothetical protein